MSYTLFTQSHKAWDAMLRAIERAEKSVYLEMYIFLGDTFPTHNFTELLARKAKEGVDTKIVVDALGSAFLDNTTITTLREAGVELLFFSEFFRRTHRKIIVVDEKVGLIGGVNIGKEYHSWLDLQMELDGPIVKSLTRSFQKSYIAAGGKDKQFIARRLTGGISKAKFILLERWPGKEKNPLHAHYRDQFRKAQKSITIVTPYFIPHGWLLDEIKNAVARGVRVEVVASENASPKIADIASRLTIAALKPSGIHFYFTKELHHAKALLIDDEEGMIGSYNVDPLSFDHNLEAGVLFKNKALIHELRAVIESWKKNANPYNEKLHKPAWYTTLLGPLIRFIEPIL